MKARLAASAALALGIALGASGCSMLTYQATTEPYDASDGVGVNVGNLHLRNVLVVSDDGVDGTLVLTIVNDGDEDVELGVQVADGETETIPVDAGATVAFGVADEDELDVVQPLVLRGIDTKPGALLPIYFQYGSAEGIEKNIPVLDGRLPEYAGLLPAEVEVEEGSVDDATAAPVAG
ncbi:hypothetical protein MUN74_14155 [Agromyces endophyticus]|uniref:hypothetical protein n=1 Tax=Agromyces sp. H17E-10 TaxID=2932244 RepID=UPI001FD1797E|nr:hypothetical protein [Agromyces sp. H17E-10]UOQ88413.1 hypothetical protein MUN74_14155 [Agromyces sp. H17E-10]